MKNSIFNERNLKLWSTLGSRATLGLAAMELVKTNEKLMILTSDVSTSAGLDRYRKSHPEHYLDVGIAEQNLIGIASGFASEGFDVVTTTFAPFQTLRCCEQIKVNLSYMKQKVTMVGLASGLVLGNLGYTHCSIEDVGILRSLPNLAIVSPADPTETVKALFASINYHQSVYIRLTGGSNAPQIYKSDYDFEIGKSIKLVDGDDLLIIASGSMVKTALDCSKNLNERKIYPEVINMHTIKPIDKDQIYKSVEGKKLVVTIEEHNVIGGLGSAVSEVISEIDKCPKKISFGINDMYSKGGSYSYLKKKFGLDYNEISDKIERELNNNG
ncbi:transketolase family protein [Candidatus Pelagibacter sp.]|uniref:transketolase family protein n=1 Tax=Candidatus Pelagibacter sp. TaxID=2024849 RepID=UPI003F84B478